MAGSKLTRFLRGSLALPGALLDALRPRSASGPEPLLWRLRSVLERLGEEEAGPLTATFSEVRLYGGPLGPGTAAEPSRALDVRGPDPIARELEDARGELARRLWSLGSMARELSLAIADRMDDDLAALAAGLDGLSMPPRSRRKRRRTVARLGRLLEVARGVEVSPGRGRRRDLKQVAKTIKRLRRLGVEAGIPWRRSVALAPRRS